MGFEYLDPIPQPTLVGAVHTPSKPVWEHRHERAEGDAIQCALLNILEDLTAEQNRFQAAQRAMLNILEDFDMEKSKVEVMNRELQAEVEARQRVQEEINKLNQELEQRVMERTAELAASNKELEAFSYSVSHDLRAPLRGMDGICQALMEDYADTLAPGGKGLLERVRAASQRMDRLIEGLLGLSRTTRGEIRRTAVDLSAQAESCARELQKGNPARRAEFVIAPGLVVHGDTNLLRTVLENLLSNAWKFTGKHPRARIEFGVVQHECERAYFVRDDGAGFDMAYANKLFGAFQRLHNPTEFEGTGIGLANVQRIIHRHGGRVWAEGAVERGASFFFTIPMNPR
jgi:light-regulated signal transduction histidine kinase (bacteriophytochrome)